MNKKQRKIIILVLVLLIFLSIGFFINEKINAKKRSYEIEKVENQSYFILKEKEKYGIINTKGEIILEPQYDEIEIPNPSKDIFTCCKDNKWIALNSEKKQLFTEYNSVQAIELNNVAYDFPNEKSILKSEKNGKYGLINLDGKKITDTIYDSIESFSKIEGQFIVSQNEKYGIINLKGTIMVPVKYDKIISDDYYTQENGYKYSGYIIGQKDGEKNKYGYINEKGKMLLKPEYSKISRVNDVENYKDVYLIAAQNDKYKILKNKRNIIKDEYDLVEYNKEANIFIVKKNEKYGAINIKGKEIISIDNIELSVKGKNIYAQRDSEKIVYNNNGEKIDLDYNKSIIPTANENYNITINSSGNTNYYGLVDANGNELIKSEYLYIGYAFDNYFIVKEKGGKIGVVDDKNNIKIEKQYDSMQKIQDKNVLQAKKKEGEDITEIYSKELKKTGTMKNAIVENNKNYICLSSNEGLMYFNNEGETISSSKVFSKNKLFAKYKDGKWGYADSEGIIKILFEYEKVTEFNEYGFASVKKDGKWGCIDESGKTVVEPKYSINNNYKGLQFIGEYYKVEGGYVHEYYTKGI